MIKQLTFITLLVGLSTITLAQTTFSEQAASWGINTGSSKDGGHAFADYDGDGDLDLLVNTFSGSQYSRLYRNNGNNTFTDVTSSLAPLLLSNIRERAAVWGDVNNDGRIDFLRNTGGSAAGNLRDIEIYLQASNGVFGNGLGGTNPITCGANSSNDVQLFNGTNTEGVGMLDFDGDGDLDIFFDNHNYGIDVHQAPQT